MNPFAKLLACVLKEFRVIARDRAGLAVLFLMPLGFVTVMSLALQDVFSKSDASAKPRFSMAVLDDDGGEAGKAIVDALAALEFLQVTRLPSADLAHSPARLRVQVRSGQQRFALIVPAGLTDKLDGALASATPGTLFEVPDDRKITLDLLVDPALRSDHRLLVTVAIEGILQAIEIRRATGRFAQLMSPAILPSGGTPALRRSGLLRVDNRALETGTAKGDVSVTAPTSTQQNVPAYSLLAIFMLVVPLSQTFIKERAQGSLTRLRSMPVPGWVIIGGKFLPYFVINLLQMALCLGVGRFVLPLLGASALRFEHALTGVALLSAAASTAAIGFALVVSLYARTVEQATAFGATAILLLAALGGIMVPRMIMPPVLQHVALISPLGWAQEGFLDLFVRGAHAADVLHRAGALFAFGIVCMALAGWRFAALGNDR